MAAVIEKPQKNLTKPVAKKARLGTLPVDYFADRQELLIPPEKRNFPASYYDAPVATEEEDIEFMLRNPQSAYIKGE